MITEKDTANLCGMARLARIHSRRCNACVEVVNSIEGALVYFATNEPYEGLDSLHEANAHLGAITDLTVRVPIRQLLTDIIERLEEDFEGSI